jgi:hypothetical protein
LSIEIRELVIRAVVEPQGAEARRRLPGRELERLKRQVVAECLERLLRERGSRPKR